MTGQKVVKRESQRGSHRWSQGAGQGNPLSGPSEATLARMVHPPTTPVGETHGITVSRHAEFIFDVCRSSRGRHISHPGPHPRSEAYLTYGGYGKSKFRCSAGRATLFGHALWSHTLKCDLRLHYAPKASYLFVLLMRYQ